MKIENAKSLPQVYWGLHMYPGPAEYREPGQAPYRILLNEATIRDMDATFIGKPVYVGHVDEVDLNNIQQEADGYVVDAQYNNLDGKHWVKFIVVSDKGHEAIRNGWKLSNAYVPKSFAQGGVWNGIDYQKEVMSAEYEHLAIVPDPRYEASIILTPTQFKEYNESHRLELSKVANSKFKEKSNMFKFFKKTEAEAADVSELTIKLSNGKEVSIADLIKNAEAESDKAEAGEHKAKKEMPKMAEDKNPEEAAKQGEKADHRDAAPQMANMDHHIPMNGGTMALKDLMAEHAKMKDCMNTLAAHHAKMSNLSEKSLDGGEKDAEHAEASADLTKRNADLDGGEKEAEDQEKVADKTKRNSGHIEAIKNAPLEVTSNQHVDLDAFERGISRYGSN